MVTSNIEKFLHVFDSGCECVVWKTIEKHLPVPLLCNPVIQQDQNASIRTAADQPAKSLFQRDSRLRNLVIVEWIPSGSANGFDPGMDHGIVGNRERQLIYNNAAQLLARHIHPLPE